MEPENLKMIELYNIEWDMPKTKWKFRKRYRVNGWLFTITVINSARRNIFAANNSDNEQLIIFFLYVYRNVFFYH